MTETATQPQPADTVLRLRDVAKRFGGVQAVKDVDLDVTRGERRAILGPNGAGKTTLFNLVAGDFRPSGGTIEILGVDMTNQPARRRTGLGLARTYQKSRLFLGLTVEDNLYLAVVGREGGRLRPIPSAKDKEYRERAREVAEKVWLGHRLKALVRNLSHGEQRQLELGLARVTDPEVMMLDEPASGLSRGEREQLTELLLKLDPSVTLILIEHDMDVALTVAERVTMMHDGRVIVEGTPAEIRKNDLVHDLYLGRAHRGDD
jgi:branched-chain amino acid transport system ATP-binding protein